MSFDANSMEDPTTAQHLHSINEIDDFSSNTPSTFDPVSDDATDSVEQPLTASEADITTGALALELDALLTKSDVLTEEEATSSEPVEDLRESDFEEDHLRASNDDRSSLPDLEHDDQDSMEDNYGVDAPENGECNGEDDSEMISVVVIEKLKKKNPKACLQGIPGELQDMILKLLLVNGELGRSTSIDEENGYGTTAAYGLHPAILRVCKSLYERGCGVL
jgi:hypothetical protein